MNKNQSWWSVQNPSFWGLLTVIFAFAGVISLFHVNSYVADKYNINGLFTWGGIVLLLIAAYTFYKVTSTSGGKADRLD